MATEATSDPGRFVWHECVTTDAAKAQDFYRDLLGWSVEVWKPGEMDYTMISVDGTMHGGFGAAHDGVPSQWLGHVEVEGLDGAIARATGAGGTVIAGPFEVPEVGRMCAVSDPRGAVFSLFEPESAAPQAEGVFLWDELLTDDVEGAKRFYGEVLGWTSGDMEMGEGGTYTMFRRAGQIDSAGCMATPEGVPVPAVWLTYVNTSDLDATVARVAGLGGEVQTGPMDIPDIGRFAVITDPTGAAVGLFEPAQS